MSRFDRLCEALNEFFDRFEPWGVWLFLAGCLLFIAVFTYVTEWLSYWLGNLLQLFLLQYFPWLPPNTP